MLPLFGASRLPPGGTLAAQCSARLRLERTHGLPLTPQQLDEVLALQLSVAWAGEAAGAPRRLGWWETDLIDAEGGGDLFARLVPRTAAWAGFELARAAARRVEFAALSRMARRDAVWTLFHFGFELDEQLDERLAHHRRHRHEPAQVLGPGLRAGGGWSAEDFAAWLKSHGDAPSELTPSGRLIHAKPADATQAARLLASALVPFERHYPLPFLEVGGG